MFNSFSIAKRLAMGFGGVLALLLVVALSGYWGMESVTHETVSMLRGDAKLSQLADEAKITTLELRRFEKDTLLNMDNKPKMQDYQDKWKAQLGKLRTTVADLHGLAVTAEDKQLVDQMDSEIDIYQRGV